MFKITPTLKGNNTVSAQKLQGTPITLNLNPTQEEALIWSETEDNWRAGIDPEEGTVRSLQNASNSGNQIVLPPYTTNPTVKTLVPSGIVTLQSSSASVTIGMNHSSAQFGANYGGLTSTDSVATIVKTYSSRYVITSNQVQVYGRVDIGFTFLTSPVSVEALSFEFDVVQNSINSLTELGCILNSGAFQNRNIDVVFTDIVYVNSGRVRLSCSVIDDSFATNSYTLSLNYCVNYTRS